MPTTLHHPRHPAKGQLELPWPSYEALNEAALRAADVALGHDVEQLSLDCGLSRRELNKQRERRPEENEGGPAALGRQTLYRAALLLAAVRSRFGAERVRPAARLIARACGVELADEIAPAESRRKAELAIIADATAEACQAAALASEAAADGIDPREAERLLPQVAEVLERWSTLRAFLEAKRATSTANRFSTTAS